MSRNFRLPCAIELQPLSLTPLKMRKVESRLAEQGNAGKAFGPEGPLGSGPVYLDYVGKGTFYVLLASLRGQLFSDDDFAKIYCSYNGRDSVPPSLLATVLLLQTYDKVSDA